MVTGGIDDVEAMRAAVAGADAVVVTLGVRYRKSHPWGGIEGRTDVVPAALRTLLSAAPGGGAAPHVVLLSAFGAGDSWQQLPWIARTIISSSSLRTAFAALGEGEGLLRHGHLPHTVVRAVTLSDGPATDQPADATGYPLRGNPTVSRADVATLLLDTALARIPGRVITAAPARFRGRRPGAA